MRSTEGHECSRIAAEVSLPGSIAAREHSVRQHAASQGHSVLAQARTCSLKEAVKLTLFAPLAAALGKRLDQDAEVRIGLLFLHPETSHETEALMGGPPSRQPGKRKRGHTQASRRSQTGEWPSGGLPCLLHVAWMSHTCLGMHQNCPCAFAAGVTRLSWSPAEARLVSGSLGAFLA